jgi:hypothetical protein
VSTADELRRIAEQVLCVFNHVDQDGVQARSAPGRVACTSCTERVLRDLGTLQHLYDGVTDVDELTPGGSPDSAGGRSVPGPRSPAVDALLVHTDPRSVTGPGESPAALASIVGWARLVREDTTVEVAPEFMLAVVPSGRVTMRRELAAIRGAWPWVTGQVWFADFAAEVRGVINALRQTRRETEPVIRIGGCEKALVAFPGPGGALITLSCGATLRVRPSDTEIRCRNCGHVWTKDRWHELGNPWTDYAFLGGQLDVNPNTLRGWAREDEWRSVKLGRRVVVWRDDAIASYVRRRGPKLEEAG